MKIKKIFYLFTLVLPLAFVACSNNSDEVDPPSPPAALDPLNLDNMIGNWEVYYSTRVVKLGPQEQRETTRDINYDGYRVVIEKINSTEGSYKEYNADDVLTANGTVTFVGDTAMHFKGKIRLNANASADTTVIKRPYISKANQYMEISSSVIRYTEPTTGQYKPHQIIDRTRYRNQNNAISANTYPDMKIPKIIVKQDFLTSGGGTWEITAYEHKRYDYATGKEEGLTATEITAELGVYDKNTNSGSKYEFFDDGTYQSWLPNDVQSASGRYKICDDVIQFFYNTTNSSGQQVAASSSILVINMATSSTPNTFQDNTVDYEVLNGVLKRNTRSTTFSRVD